MKSLTNTSQLSTSETLKPYEIERWDKLIKAGAVVPGEKERYTSAMEAIGDKLKLIDMSGTINASIGSKGIPEISKILQDGQNKGNKPVGIIIDYAGIMVERYMAGRNEKVENEFHYLNRFVNNVRVEIAAKFNCIVWILHQLHGDAASSSPTTRQHHSKARGARNFADNANFAFNLGTKDPKTNCCLITCSKARRSEGLKDPPIVRIDGPFGALIPEDKRFALDIVQKKFVDRQIADIYQTDIKDQSDRIAKRTSKLRSFSVGDI